MADIDSLITDAKIALNRPSFSDGSGTDVTATTFPGIFNKSVHKLERKLLTPYQTFFYQPTLTPNQQVYSLLPPAPPGTYRATREITMPWQSIITTQNIGARINYLPHDKARAKWQLNQFVTQNVQNTGMPQDYSIFYATPATPGPATLSLVASATGGTLASGTYFYVATAVIGGLETVISPEQSVSVTGPTGSVAATIGAVTGAAEYKLYRGTVTAKENVIGAYGTGPSLTDTGALTVGAPFAAGPGYWMWPSPDKAYLLNVDQLIFFPDLVAAQSPAQTNWFTLNTPDLLLWEMCLLAATMLGDDPKINRFKPLRDEAFVSAIAAIAELGLGEQGVPAGMVEPG